MEEKIKIYLAKETLQTLLKDMEMFEFYKKDGNLNKNDFLNTLIINWFWTSTGAWTNEVFHSIKKIVKDTDMSIAYDILQIFETKVNRLDEAKFDALISLKPTKRSSSVIHYIQQCLLQGSTMSNYFRNMLTSYSLLPQDKREQIIFKENYELLKEAIRKKQKVYFTTTTSDVKHVTSPYTIASAKEELFNYLLTEYKDKAYSFRLSRIKEVVILNEPCEFSEEIVASLEKMLVCGPQFAINDEQEICVELTEHGQQMYKKMYLHRPTPVRVENNYYYFDCSSNHIYQYFFRFGNHAYVVYPKELRNDMEQGYQNALRLYQRKKRY